MTTAARQSPGDSTALIPAARLRGRAASLAVFGALLLSLALFLIAPLLYLRAMDTPFAGVFVTHTLAVDPARPMRPGEWGPQLPLPAGSRAVAVDGEPVSDLFEFQRALQRRAVGEPLTLTLVGRAGDALTLETIRRDLPVMDRIGYFLVPYLIGLAYLLCGWYMYLIRRADRAGRAFSLFAAFAAAALAASFDLRTTGLLAPVWISAVFLTGAALINLALLFPTPLPAAERRPYLAWIGYAPAVAAALGAAPTLYNTERPEAFAAFATAAFIFTAAAGVFFLALTVYRRYRAVSTAAREQARLILFGALLGFTPPLAALGWLQFNPNLPLAAFYGLAAAIFPVFTAYAIVRYRSLQTDFIVSRGLLYILLTGMAVAAYALIVGGLSMILGQAVDPAGAPAVGLIVFLLAVALLPARERLQQVIDRYLFRGRLVEREVQQAFGQELTRLMDLGEILAALRRTVDAALTPNQMHLFVFDPAAGGYAAVPDDLGRPTSDVRFAQAGPLPTLLSRRSETLFLTDFDRLPAELRADAARLALLGAIIHVPIPGRRQAVGWLSLAGRRSGEPYTARDLSFLEALCNQAALAVERAQVVADLERRVREMNVLTRVAQGVSFTVAFDDILELISAQTNQVAPARDFRITLQDPETGWLRHAFFLEDDERLAERENRPLPPGYGLEQEVIHGRRAIVCDDYEHECRLRGVLPDASGLYAWAGVPLNAGADTIGALSVGSRAPGAAYTDEQISLLQAIADQTSGAIVKARSLEESQRRALQLAKLNEIGLGLTSTLQLKPLLSQILTSAVEILECEAGSLFLIDPHTDELVFEVVLGPVAGDLIGKRLPRGAGLVGRAVETGQPIIANDAKRRKEWFDKPDEQTGFDTQDLLAAPMRMQDRVIGVIEVINKSNGSPFTLTDQDLLTAFTSQATIAIENARLYTLTDQALAARVEELSVMQRIDRELNAGLDVDRAMRLTLDWAVRQTQADAGLIAAVEAGGVRPLAFHGCSDEQIAGLSGADGGDDPVEEKLPLVHAMLRSGGAGGCRAAAVGDAPGSEAPALLPGGRRQIITPIRRETAVIAILLLELRSLDPVTEDLISFMNRLSDHAAIALANARLYEEVTEANLAKSRFVSFVAHELKNPMASIKGYTELVASGMAGPVNEMQTGFLATVRSNVDRMNTIVSDLNDLTKIQTGNMRLDFRSVDLGELLEEVTRSFRRQVDEKKQTLEIIVPEALPPLWADPARLTQILTNLLSNAHKYTPEGKAITVRAEYLPAGEDAGARVRLSVADQGIGISEEDRKKIFEQYFRTDTAKEMASGTGLGLAITRSLVELQGGRIWFESELGAGTTFSFTMPTVETPPGGGE